MSPLVVFFVVIGVAAVIAIISFIIYRILRPSLKEEKPSEEQFLKEELDRVLQPVEDEETARKISEYKDEEDK